MLEHVERLNAVLRAIRNVNQLITKENDRQRLIEGACDVLTEGLSYYNAWIALLDETGARVAALTGSGLGDGLAALRARLDEGKWPTCMRRALEGASVVTLTDPAAECEDCPLPEEADAGRSVLSRRLEFGNRTFGVLTVSVAHAFADDDEEQSLFAELAGDLGFALHRIDTAERLEDARRRYREIFEGSRDGFVMVDGDGRILDANRAYCDMLGYSLDELRGLADFYQITPERWREWEATEIWHKRLPTGGASGAYEKEYIRKDGTVFPVELHAYAVRDDAGELEYLWASVRDITERRRAEAMLRDSRDELERAQAIAKVGSWRFDLDTGDVIASPEAHRIYGLGDARWTIEAVQAIPLPRYREMLDAALDGLISDGKPYDVVFEIERPSDGAVRHIHSVARFDPEHKLVIGTLRDITERVRAEQRAARHHQRLEAIVEILQHDAGDTQAFLDHALDRAIALTGSSIGSIYFYDEDRRELVLNIWSKEVMAECSVADPQTCYELDRTGIWGEAVRQRRPIVINDFQAEHPLKRGVPEGHVHLRSFLTVPVFDRDRIVAVVGVANKDGDYDDTDALELTLLMDAVWKSVETAEGERALHRIEWLLSSRPAPAPASYEPPYGDLTGLNADGLIRSSVGPELLTDIVSDYLDLLGTSAAVYERGGDYALGIFSSGWCRFLDAASRRLCDTDDDREALACGRWLCHESCWSDASLESIRTGAPADVECHGGLRIHAVPVVAGDDVVGAVNFGYGDPPQDPARLRELAERYRVDEDELRRQAEAYESRPPFIVELAKKRLGAAARLIGEIVERKRTESALADSEQRYRGLFENAQDAFYEVTMDGTIVDVSPSVERLSGGYRRDELIGRSLFDLYAEPEARARLLTELERRGAVSDYEIALKTPDGGAVECSISARIQPGADGRPERIIGSLRDVSERKRLEAQLLQAHKMESIGRLAGGVAHDFNNQLNVILGHAELALGELPADAEIRSDLEEIAAAARRSADLTGQLLAFARKQTIALRVLDLNRTVETALKMLRRLVTESIQLVWKPGSGLAPVRLDPAQLDQLLTNLVVNSRDAIGHHGGAITIETGRTYIDDEAYAGRLELSPGDYVTLIVSDDGPGMDTDTMAKIFEPFFTTKAVGEGTGLGLATVHGIVRQNRGAVNVYSEPGHGSTFRIYLPAHAGSGAVKVDDAALPAPAGNETILLVEDEPAILALGARMLERLGYRPLTAATPGEAIRIAEEHAGDIDLLITDVVMPEMNGRDLARRLLSLCPKIKRLFMSGYTADVIAHQGVLDDGVHFIQKPFSMAELAIKVSEALERKD